MKSLTVGTVQLKLLTISKQIFKTFEYILEGSHAKVTPCVTIMCFSYIDMVATQ